MGAAQVDAHHYIPTWWDGSDCASTLTKEGAGGNQRMPDKDNFGAVLTPIARDNAAHAAVAMVNMQGSKSNAVAQADGPSYTLNAMHGHDVHAVAFTRCDNGRDALVKVTPTMRCGSNYSAHLAVAIGFNPDQSAKTRSMGEREQQAPTLRAGAEAAVAFEPRYYTRDNKTGGAPSDVAVLKADAQKMGDSAPHVATTMAVRRLTPVECERLQGFPDGYTAIPWRGKPATECPDGPRYRALGNSMAVPCMRWIGERIAQVDALDGR